MTFCTPDEAKAQNDLMAKLAPIFELVSEAEELIDTGYYCPDHDTYGLPGSFWSCDECAAGCEPEVLGGVEALALSNDDCPIFKWTKGACSALVRSNGTCVTCSTMRPDKAASQE